MSGIQEERGGRSLGPLFFSYSSQPSALSSLGGEA